MGVVRLTLENTTNKTIKRIRIAGCNEKSIPDLKPGESQTVWIDIPNDCSVEINYIDASGSKKNKEVLEYITPGNGKKIHWQFTNN